MTQTVSKNSKMYARLFEHCQNQYKNISVITKAYIKSGQVYAIDYITTGGVNSISSGTFDSDKVITFN